MQTEIAYEITSNFDGSAQYLREENAAQVVKSRMMKAGIEPGSGGAMDALILVERWGAGLELRVQVP